MTEEREREKKQTKKSLHLNRCEKSLKFNMREHCEAFFFYI